MKTKNKAISLVPIGCGILAAGIVLMRKNPTIGLPIIILSCIINIVAVVKIISAQKDQHN